MEEQDRKDRKKLKKIGIGVGIFLVIGAILCFLQMKPPKQLTEAEVSDRVAEILAAEEPEWIESDGQRLAQYVADNRDMVHVTELEDGIVRYEYTCKKTQLVYVYQATAGETAAAGMEVYDVQDYLHQQLPPEEEQ